MKSQRQVEKHINFLLDLNTNHPHHPGYGLEEEAIGQYTKGDRVAILIILDTVWKNDPEVEKEALDRRNPHHPGYGLEVVWV